MGKWKNKQIMPKLLSQRLPFGVTLLLHACQFSSYLEMGKHVDTHFFLNLFLLMGWQGFWLTNLPLLECMNILLRFFPSILPL
jgi:hypothetical protein